MPEGIHYCIRCGSPVHLEIKYGAQRPVCAQCGWIYFADPKVAVEVLVEKDNQVLLVKRGNEPQLGLWSQPGGFVDAWEDPARAAERECLEETGLVVKVARLLDVIAGHEYPGGADIVIAYRAEIVGGQLAAGDDALQAGFFSRAELPPLAFKATQRILDM
jgi:ADP-ribose pyrophosphatase YjhB (NUDIX family)